MGAQLPIRGSNLESAFAKAFNSDLPLTLNTNHSIIIVASKIDPSSERIINYLSRTHGVNINALTFQYFCNDSDEMVGRVFHIEPTLVEQSTYEKTISKRKPNLSYEELQKLADEKGGDIGSIYKTLIHGLVPQYFTRTSTTLSSICFRGNYGQLRDRVIFSLVVTESDSSTGLKFRFYSFKFTKYIGVSERDILSWLPDDCISWTNSSTAEPEWSGYEGFIKSIEDINKFLNGLAEVEKHVSQDAQN